METGKMNTIKFTCSCCGKEHEEWPALTYVSPTNYDALSDEDKDRIGEIDSDLCMIKHADQADRFIRCTLTQKVKDHCEDLEYGLWVSLSEKSFANYLENFENEQHETMYFGWLSNSLPEYDFSNGSIPTTVFTRTGNSRPEIVPHEDFDHPFVYDYYNGISKEEAERRIHEMLRVISTRDAEKTERKPWWKFWQPVVVCRKHSIVGFSYTVVYNCWIYGIIFLSHYLSKQWICDGI